MATADALVGLKDILLGHAEVSALCEQRVYGGELPQEQAASMPRKAILLRWAGGGGPLYRLLTVWRVDVYCWGETPYEASVLHRTVHACLKHVSHGLVANVMVYSIEESGGPLQLREPDTLWPAVVQSWVITFADDP
jgi:hypothetical protein